MYELARSVAHSHKTGIKVLAIWSLGSSSKPLLVVVAGLQSPFACWLLARATQQLRAVCHCLPCDLLHNMAVCSFRTFERASAAALNLPDFFCLWPLNLLYKGIPD